VSRDLGAHGGLLGSVGAWLPIELLSSLGDLELIAKTAVDGVMSGLHRSRQPGFSLEFEDYRPHVVGSDPRWIDWNAYARSGRLLEKRFTGETTAPLHLLVDTSASMGEGRGAKRSPEGDAAQLPEVTKLCYAQWIAATLSWLALRQRDPVGVGLYAASLFDYVAPGTRTLQWHRILRCLEAARPASGTQLEQATESLRARALRRGMLAVLSDFYCDPQELLRALRPLVYRGQDLMLFQILSPRELEPQVGDARMWVDAETDRRIPVSSEYLERVYPGRLRAHLDSMRDAAGELGATYLMLDTREPLDLAVRAFLRFRRRRG